MAVEAIDGQVMKKIQGPTGARKAQPWVGHDARHTLDPRVPIL